MTKIRQTKAGPKGKVKSKVRTTNKSTPTGPRNKKPLIIGALALVGGLWFMIREPNASNHPMPAKAPEAVESKSQPKPVMELPDEPDPEQTPEALARRRERSFAKHQLGIESLKLEEANGVIKIPLVFRPEKRWCQGGDLDTVSFLKPSPDSPEFLITIETMVGKQRGDKMRVSASTLFEGFERVFEVPVRNSPESFGLYICRDQGKTGTCRGKVLESHSVISDKLADNKTSIEAMKQDYQLYFQNFVVKDGELLAYTNENLKKEHTDKLKSHLSEAYNLGGAEFKAAMDVHKILRSVPAKVQDNKIILALPYNDPRCAPGQPPPAE